MICLQNDLLLYILYYLDIQNVMSALCVCKKWNALLKTKTKFLSKRVQEYKEQHKGRYHMDAITNFMQDMCWFSMEIYEKKGLSKVLQTYFPLGLNYENQCIGFIYNLSAGQSPSACGHPSVDWKKFGLANLKNTKGLICIRQNKYQFGDYKYNYLYLGDYYRNYGEENTRVTLNIPHGYGILYTKYHRLEGFFQDGVFIHGSLYDSPHRLLRQQLQKTKLILKYQGDFTVSDTILENNIRKSQYRPSKDISITQYKNSITLSCGSMYEYENNNNIIEITGRFNWKIIENVYEYASNRGPKTNTYFTKRYEQVECVVKKNGKRCLQQSDIWDESQKKRLKVGDYKMWYSNGNLKYDLYFESPNSKSKFNGDGKYYYPDGKLVYDGKWVNGKMIHFSGELEKYYTNTPKWICLKGPMVNGIKHGMWTTYEGSINDMIVQYTTIYNNDTIEKQIEYYSTANATGSRNQKPMIEKTFIDKIFCHGKEWDICGSLIYDGPYYNSSAVTEYLFAIPLKKDCNFGPMNLESNRYYMFYLRDGNLKYKGTCRRGTRYIFPFFSMTKWKGWRMCLYVGDTRYTLPHGHGKVYFAKGNPHFIKPIDKNLVYKGDFHDARPIEYLDKLTKKKR